jgi:uncharacterized iron-regulated protein
VVFVGESHDQFAHHLNQLAIIQGLHTLHPDLVIAMEYFQQPFQPYLDAYVGGSLDEQGMLKKTEYFERWGFDYRLYRPILRYAREHSIPLLALNIPEEIRRKVGRYGLNSLTPEERAQVPAEIDRSDPYYRKRLEMVFRNHPNRNPPGDSGQDDRDFERFLDVQLLWDESMADRAARYLHEHPDHHMVVLAGSGHIAYGSGIPQRLTRRIPADTAIVLNDALPELTPEVADFLLLTRDERLPPAGTLGVMLETKAGRASIKGFTEGSAAQSAGMKLGDRFLAIDDYPVQAVGDIKIALLDHKPGETIQVKAVRSGPREREMRFSVTLR